MKQRGSDDPVRDLAKAWERVVKSPSRQVDQARLDDSETRRLELSPYGVWKFLGPGNIGGRTRVLVIDPVEPRVMYAGGVSGGIWKTLNAGGDWFPIGDDLANIAINSLAMHPSNRNTLYAGTGEGYFREVRRGTALPLRGDGIFVTHDAGATWSRLPSTANENFHYVNDLIVTANEIYAATRTGVWRSADSGATWTRVLVTNVLGGCLDLARGNDLFASCGTFEQATIYRMRGGAFEPVFTEPDMGRTSLAVAPSNPNVVYALSANNDDQGLHAVFRSTDGGTTWTARLRNTDPTYAQHLLANLSTEYGCWGAGNAHVTMGWYCNTIAVDPADENRVWAAGVDAFRSDDGGETFGIASYWWATDGMTKAWLHADQHSIVFDPRYDGVSNRAIYFTNDGGIFRSDDARAAVAVGSGAPCNFRASSMEYVPLNNGFGVSQFYHGAVSPDGKTFLGGAQDNGTLMGMSSRGPNRWWTNIGGDGGYAAIDPNDPKIMYAEYQWGHLYRSTNGGLFYRDIRPPDARDADFLFVTPFTLDPNHTARLWLGGRVMQRFLDNQWTVASPQLPAMVSAIAVQPGDSDVVLAGTAEGHIMRTDRALTATASTQWQMAKPREGFVSSLAFDPTNANAVFATYAGFGGTHIYFSNDAGITWSPMNSATLPDIPVHSLAVDPTNPIRLYLGTDLGVFVSFDRGLT
ncbi:MAG TPA: hypothetical protein VM733_18135, partial [Thermoanaerobaculia bacterium]|nr:hypothetical protein [Thermoanaerobaculia bacterium]